MEAQNVLKSDPHRVDSGIPWVGGDVDDVNSAAHQTRNNQPTPGHGGFVITA